MDVRPWWVAGPTGVEPRRLDGAVGHNNAACTVSGGSIRQAARSSWSRAASGSFRRFCREPRKEGRPGRLEKLGVEIQTRRQGRGRSTRRGVGRQTAGRIASATVLWDRGAVAALADHESCSVAKTDRGGARVSVGPMPRTSRVCRMCFLVGDAIVGSRSDGRAGAGRGRRRPIQQGTLCRTPDLRDSSRAGKPRAAHSAIATRATWLSSAGNFAILGKRTPPHQRLLPRGSSGYCCTSCRFPRRRKPVCGVQTQVVFGRISPAQRGGGALDPRASRNSLRTTLTLPPFEGYVARPPRAYVAL